LRLPLAIAVLASLLASALAVPSAIADDVPVLAGVARHVSNASDVDASDTPTGQAVAPDVGRPATVARQVGPIALEGAVLVR